MIFNANRNRHNVDSADLIWRELYCDGATELLLLVLGEIFQQPFLNCLTTASNTFSLQIGPQ
jgi:hypothetical protein